MNENQKPAKDVSRWNLSVIRLISGRTNHHQETLVEIIGLEDGPRNVGTPGKVVPKWHVRQTCASHNQGQTPSLFGGERLTFIEHAKRPGECTCFRLATVSSTSTLQPQQEQCFSSLQHHLQNPSGDPCPAHYHSKRFLLSMLPQHSMYLTGTNT